MTVQIICSNCGRKSRKYVIDKWTLVDPADKFIEAGWNSFGSAFYCKTCVRTWEQRNGKDRPLWGKGHTRERVYQTIVGQLQDEIEYLKTGEWPV